MTSRWDHSMRAYIDDEKGRIGMGDRGFAEGMRRAAEIARGFVEDLTDRRDDQLRDYHATAALIHARQAQTANDIAIMIDREAASISPDPQPMASEDEAIAEALLAVEGFGFYTDPMEAGQDAYDLSVKAIDDAVALRHELVTRGLTISALSDRQMLVEALEELRSYAASVWFDEAKATDEEHQLMGKTRAALAKAKGA